MIIDIDKLRKELAETPDIERASDEELIEMAQKQGIDLRKYEI